MTKYRKVDSLSSPNINKENIYLKPEYSYDIESSIIKYYSGCTLQQGMTDDELINQLFPEANYKI